MEIREITDNDRNMQKTLYSGYSANCCAYCKLHRCGMTAKQMKKKDCLNKQCYHLEKYEDHPIWEQRRRKKEKRKAEKMAKNMAFKGG